MSVWEVLLFRRLICDSEALAIPTIDKSKIGGDGDKNKKIILYFNLFFSLFLTVPRPFFPLFHGSALSL